MRKKPRTRNFSEVEKQDGEESRGSTASRTIKAREVSIMRINVVAMRGYYKEHLEYPKERVVLAGWSGSRHLW